MMRRKVSWCAVVLALALCGEAPGQQPGNAVRAGRAGGLPGTAVQLPTFSHFSVGTTVLVPDRGATHLGGISRASDGANQFGVPGLGRLPFAGRPFTNRGIGSQRSASNMHVTATIHDFEEMDRQLLGQASGRSAPAARPAAPGAAAGSGLMLVPRHPDGTTAWHARSAPSPAVPSIEEARARRAEDEAARGQEAADYFARGRRAEAEGKANVARIYYEMAQRRATGELHDLIAARLEALRLDQSGPQVAQSRP